MFIVSSMLVGVAYGQSLGVQDNSPAGSTHCPDPRDNPDAKGSNNKDSNDGNGGNNKGVQDTNEDEKDG